MSLSQDEIRNEAWKQFIDARGAQEIFNRRATSLKRWMRARDFLAVAIPVIVAFFATTDFIQKIGDLKAFALAVLAIASVGQVLLSFWSLIARWDESRSISLQLSAESNVLEVQWRDIGKGHVKDFELAYNNARARQQLLDAKLATAEITQSERVIGLRAGLKEIPRECMACNNIPSTIDPPWFPGTRCPVCGGNA